MAYQFYDDHYEPPFGSNIYVADGMIYNPIKYISDFFEYLHQPMEDPWIFLSGHDIFDFVQFRNNLRLVGLFLTIISSLQLAQDWFPRTIH